MSELLFVELGAAVRTVLGETKCLFVPYCTMAKPTYEDENCLEADFTKTLNHVLVYGPAVESAEYDQFVDAIGSPPIGPSWPGAMYEGVVRIREDLVTGKLKDAAGKLTGNIYEHQVVAVVVEGQEVRRYCGFHAEVARMEGSVLVLKVANGGTGGTEAPSWVKEEVHYNPADTEQFYSGPLVADWVIGGGALPGSSGAVYILRETAATVYGLSVPKKPPSYGL